MNKYELFQRRQEVANLIRISNRQKNVLKFSASETDAHIQMKLEICKWLTRHSIGVPATFGDIQAADFAVSAESVVSGRKYR